MLDEIARTYPVRYINTHRMSTANASMKHRS
jgi:hypothetical protein